MPGKDSGRGLPPSVRENLPAHARDIYKKAHDNALEQYKDSAGRCGDASLAETAHRVAWSAVKQQHRKNATGEWVRKSE